MSSSKNDDTQAATQEAVENLYANFERAWGSVLAGSKASWCEVWAIYLAEFSIPTIQHASEFVTQNLRRQPNAIEFAVYCRRIEEKQRIPLPIVSDIEEIAERILAKGPEALGCDNWSRYADVCLILASVATAKNYQSHGLSFDEGAVGADIQARAAMFGSECLEWMKDAKYHKGFWVEHLAGKPN